MELQWGSSGGSRNSWRVAKASRVTVHGRQALTAKPIGTRDERDHLHQTEP